MRPLTQSCKTPPPHCCHRVVCVYRLRLPSTWSSSTRCLMLRVAAARLPGVLIQKEDGGTRGGGGGGGEGQGARAYTYEIGHMPATIESAFLALTLQPGAQEFPADQRSQYINWVSFAGGILKAKLLADYGRAPGRDDRLNVTVSLPDQISLYREGQVEKTSPSSLEKNL